MESEESVLGAVSVNTLSAFDEPGQNHPGKLTFAITPLRSQKRILSDAAGGGDIVRGNEQQEGSDPGDVKHSSFKFDLVENNENNDKAPVSVNVNVKATPKFGPSPTSARRKSRRSVARQSLPWNQAFLDDEGLLNDDELRGEAFDDGFITERMTDFDWPESTENETSKEVPRAIAPGGSGSAKILEPKSALKDRRVSAAWNDAFLNKDAESLLDFDDDDLTREEAPPPLPNLPPVEREEALSTLPDLPPVDLSFLPTFAVQPPSDGIAITASTSLTNHPLAADDADATCVKSGSKILHQRWTSEEKIAAIEKKAELRVDAPKSAATGSCEHGLRSTRIKLPGAAPRLHLSNAKAGRGEGMSPAPGAKTPASSSRTPRSAATTATTTSRQGLGASSTRLANKAAAGINSTSSAVKQSTASRAVGGTGTVERVRRSTAASGSSHSRRSTASVSESSEPSAGSHGAGGSSCEARKDLNSRFDLTSDHGDAGYSLRPEELAEANQSCGTLASGGDESAIAPCGVDSDDCGARRTVEVAAAAEDPAAASDAGVAEVHSESGGISSSAISGGDNPVVTSFTFANVKPAGSAAVAPADSVRGMVGRGSKAMRVCAPSPIKPSAAHHEPSASSLQPMATMGHRSSSESASSARSSGDSRQQQLHEWQQQQQPKQAVHAPKSRPLASSVAGGLPRHPPSRPGGATGSSVGGRPGVGALTVAARAGVPKPTSHSMSLVPASRSHAPGGASSGAGTSGLAMLRTSSTRSTGTSSDAGKRVGTVGVGSSTHGGNAGVNHGRVASAGFTFSSAATAATAKMAAAVARTAVAGTTKPRTLGAGVSALGSKATSKEVPLPVPHASTASASSGGGGGLFGLRFTAGKAEDPAAAKKGVPAAAAVKPRRLSGVGAKKGRFGFGFGGKAVPGPKEKEEKGASSGQLAGQGAAKRVAVDSKVASGKQMVPSKGNAVAAREPAGVASASTSPLAAALRVAATHSRLLGVSSRIPAPKVAGRFGFGGGAAGAKAGVGKQSEKPAGRVVPSSGAAKVEPTQGRAGQHKVQSTSLAGRESNTSQKSDVSQKSITPQRAGSAARTCNTPTASSSRSHKKPSPQAEKKAGSSPSPWIPGGVAQPSALAAADAALSAMGTPRSSDAGQQLAREREAQQHKEQSELQELMETALVTAFGNLDVEGGYAAQKEIGRDANAEDKVVSGFSKVESGGEGEENGAEEGRKTPGAKGGSEGEKGRKGLSLKAIGAFVSGGSPWKKSAKKEAAERQRGAAEADRKESGNVLVSAGETLALVCTPQKSPGRSGRVESEERGAWASTEKVGEWVGEVLETAGTPDACEPTDRRKTPPPASQEKGTGVMTTPVPAPLSQPKNQSAAAGTVTPASQSTAPAMQPVAPGSQPKNQSVSRGSPLVAAGSQSVAPVSHATASSGMHPVAPGSLPGSKGSLGGKQRRSSPLPRFLASPISSLFKSPKRSNKKTQEHTPGSSQAAAPAQQQQQQQQEVEEGEIVENEETYHQAVPTPAAESPTLPRRSLFKADLPRADLFKEQLPKPDTLKAVSFSASEQSGASSSEVGMYTAPASPAAGEEEEEESGRRACGKDGMSQRSIGTSGRGMFTAPASPDAEEGGGEGSEAAEVVSRESEGKQVGGVTAEEALDPFMQLVLKAEALGVEALETKGGKVRNSPLQTKQPSAPKNPWSPVRKPEVGPYDCTKRSLAASLDSFSLPPTSNGTGSGNSSNASFDRSGISAAYSGMGHASMRMSYGQ